MLNHHLTGPQAWRANTIDDRAAWYQALSPQLLAAVEETIGQLRRQQIATTELRLAQTPCADHEEELRPTRRALESGRGFVIVQGLPWQSCTVAELQAVYWLIGQMLGRPIPQNVQGTLLYDVCDRGMDVRTGARFSVTNAGTGCHTDNSFGDNIADYIGLLCVCPADRGGENQLVSGYSVHNELLERFPEALRALYLPFHIDRRGGCLPGQSPTARRPVLYWNGHELLFRYLRQWIEAGHDRAGQPLTAEQSAALAALDAVLVLPELSVELTLRPGEALFVNNRWALHNRSPFEDDPHSGRRRHFVRLWLERSDGVGNSF